MRLDDLDPTRNADDLGSGGGGGGGFPLLGLLPLLFGRGMGCGGIVLIALVGLAYLAMSGGGGLLGGGSVPGQQDSRGRDVPCDNPAELFACRVMTSTEQVWMPIFQANGSAYQPPRIRFYRRNAKSGCGAAQSAMGPFYCPSDQGVYLDVSFFDELSKRFGASGDFAQAYVIGHEVGHHIQHQLGTTDRVSQIQSRGSRTEGNAASVLLELQADCYAGVWATRSQRLDPGDIEEGMRAANAIGDDTLQQQSQGQVVPDSFTHGSSAQRMQWLKRGLDSGDPAQCDTFAAAGVN